MLAVLDLCAPAILQSYALCLPISMYVEISKLETSIIRILFLFLALLITGDGSPRDMLDVVTQ